MKNSMKISTIFDVIIIAAIIAMSYVWVLAIQEGGKHRGMTVESREEAFHGR